MHALSHNTQQNLQLIGLLEWACQKIELTDTQYDEAAARYGSVGRWLASDASSVLADAKIYPQGSARIRTTVRPVVRQEFDIDLVCELPHGDPSAQAGEVHALIGQRLREHETYRQMLKPINRGWRLNYANEFHLDITPAIPDHRAQNGEVLVPDRELRCWKASHPKGYAQWFDTIASVPVRGLGAQMIIKADIEPLPEQVRFHGHLRRIMQVMKRHRDRAFMRKPSSEQCCAPISIVVTTLATRAFEYVAGRGAYGDEFDLLQAVVRAMPLFIQFDASTGYRITNPTNALENFAEKWNRHPERAVAFYDWHGQFTADVAALADARGLDEVGRLLAQMLGDDISKAVLNEYSSRVGKRRASAGLALVSSGGALGIAAATVASAAIRTNTFFGK